MPASTPPSDLGIVEALVRLSALVQQVLAEVADGFGLSVLQSRLLGVLRDREPSMARLGSLLGLDKSSTTGLVDRAQRKGLAHRVEVPEDRRAFRVVLTERGRDLDRAIATEVSRQVTGLTDGLSAADRERFSQLASQVIQQHAAARGIDLSTSEGARYAGE